MFFKDDREDKKLYLEISASNTIWANYIKAVIDEEMIKLNKQDLTKYFCHCRDYFSFGKSGN